MYMDKLHHHWQPGRWLRPPGLRAFQLASLYMAAEEYYQMDPLKALIVKKFQTCTTLQVRRLKWLAVAASVYPSLRDTDDIYTLRTCARLLSTA